MMLTRQSSSDRHVTHLLMGNKEDQKGNLENKAVITELLLHKHNHHHFGQSSIVFLFIEERQLNVFHSVDVFPLHCFFFTVIIIIFLTFFSQEYCYNYSFLGSSIHLQQTIDHVHLRVGISYLKTIYRMCICWHAIDVLTQEHTSNRVYIITDYLFFKLRYTYKINNELENCNFSIQKFPSYHT